MNPSINNGVSIYTRPTINDGVHNDLFLRHAADPTGPTEVMKKFFQEAR